jgi:protein-disulfide isomerase
METKQPSKEKTSLSTPAAIVIAGAFIAAAVYFGMRNDTPIKTPQPQQAVRAGNPEAMNPITSEDHIRGDINAPVKIVEYSDTECPFCKRFHTTMQQVMNEYGKDGNVAWVYRHFPLDQLHSKARKEAEATECAAELGGNDGFWAYLDRLMEITPANNGLDPVELPKIAEYVGLDVAAFNECLSSGKYAQKIEDHVRNAAATGGQGTPWNIVVGKNGKKSPLPGAQPYESVKQAIEAALQGN